MPFAGLIWPMLLALATAPPPLQSFAGFSADSRHFAYGGFSPGAGVPTLTVVRTADGRIEKVLPVTSAKVEADLQAYLREQRFESKPRPAPPALREYAIEIRSEGERSEVVLRRLADGRAERLQVSPSAEAVRRLHLWGFSPSGRYAAFDETLASHTEFGAATGYFVVDVAEGIQKLTQAAAHARAAKHSADGGHPATNPDRE